MINFETIRWMNFLSTGNVFTEIPLNQVQNALIIGHNGAGKSTILDALCFVLFGKAFRKINKPNLINSVNGRETLVEIEFEANGKEYRIVRGMKPTVFEIYVGGTLLNQSSESRDYQEYLERYILGMNYKSFTQIVILGSASFTPFMQLTAADRRAVIEDLLDIQVFSTMNTIVKQKLQLNKEEMEKAKLALTLKTEKLGVIKKTLDGLKQSASEKLDAYRKAGREKQKVIDELKLEIAAMEEENRKQLEKVTDLNVLLEKHKKLLSIRSKAEANIHRHQSDIEFFNHNDTCPTCRQIIQDAFREQAINDHVTKIDEMNLGMLKLDKDIDEVASQIADIQNVITQTNARSRDISDKNNVIKSYMREIKEIVSQMNALSTSDQVTKDSEQELKTALKELKELEEMREKLASDRLYLDTAIQLLKDGGIKSKIIKQYLPIINKQINHYLNKMGFMVKFEINENFEETIKSRYRDEFSYQNFSEGEKTRIDLALLFTWRAIAKMRNSVATNLLILDEVFDGSLDGNGTEDFIKIMWDVLKDTNTFVISHKTDQMLDRFQKVYRFEKRKNFSELVSVA